MVEEFALLVSLSFCRLRPPSSACCKLNGWHLEPNIKACSNHANKHAPPKGDIITIIIFLLVRHASDIS